MSFETYTYGNPNADILLLQMVDDHDMELIGKEAEYIKGLTGGADFCLKAVRVNSWNDDLSPWPAPAVFGKEDFGQGAADTLDFLLREVIPEANEIWSGGCDQDVESSETAVNRERKIYLGGYSLAGLFSLWAGYQTDIFIGIAAASPSVWFSNFTEYMRENAICTNAVYLSLGDREERTKNPVMAQVGNKIREAYAHLQETGTECVLEWNKGNHFKDSDLRTAKAFAWLLKHCQKTMPVCYNKRRKEFSGDAVVSDSEKL